MLLRSFSTLQVLQKALRRANINSRYGNSWNKYSDPKAWECEAKNWASIEVRKRQKWIGKIQDEKPKGDSVLLRFGFRRKVWIKHNWVSYKQNDKDFQSPNFQNIQKRQGKSSAVKSSDLRRLSDGQQLTFMVTDNFVYPFHRNLTNRFWHIMWSSERKAHVKYSYEPHRT